MKINKNTSIACIVAIILSGICVAILGCFAPQTTGYNTIQNIMLGIFSSSIVSPVILESTHRLIYKLLTLFLVASMIILRSWK